MAIFFELRNRRERNEAIKAVNGMNGVNGDVLDDEHAEGAPESEETPLLASRR